MKNWQNQYVRQVLARTCVPRLGAHKTLEHSGGHATYSDTGQLWAESRPQLGKTWPRLRKGCDCGKVALFGSHRLSLEAVKHIPGLCGIARAAIEFPVNRGRGLCKLWYFPWLLQINMEVILGVNSQALSWSQVQQPSRRNSPKHIVHTRHLEWRETCLWVLQCFMDMAWNGTRSN